MRHLGCWLAASLLLTACASPGVSPDAGETAPLTGSIELSPARRTQATLADIASGATISLIEPSSGNTVASALTTTSGSFRLVFKNGFKPTGVPYFLEAMKGLSANSASAPLIRLRTLVSYRGGRWLSLTGGVNTLTRGTTALSALSNLKDLDDVQNYALMGSLTPQASDSPGVELPDALAVPEALSTLLSDQEYQQAWLVVDRAIAQDVDPIAGLSVRPASASASLPNGVTDAYGLWDGFGLTADGFVLSSLSATTVARGGTLTLYGHGLPKTTAGATVTLGVGGPTCTVTAASATGKSLTIAIPVGISTGAYALQLIFGPWTATKNVTVN